LVSGSVVDPFFLDPDTDPDPVFQENPDQDLIWIQVFDDQKLKKKTTA
jgi:hypothetical protein